MKRSTENFLKNYIVRWLVAPTHGGQKIQVIIHHCDIGKINTGTR